MKFRRKHNEKQRKALNPEHLESVKQLVNGCPFYTLLGIRLVELGNGYAKMEMDVDETRHMNPFGSVHGGTYASLIDCATYWAAYCDQDADTGYTTLDISVSDLSMVKSGRLTVTANAVKEGRSVCLCMAEVTDETGRLVSYGTSKLLTLKGRQSIADARRAQNLGELPPKFLD